MSAEMAEQSPMISQRNLSSKKDNDEKTSDTHRGDISQRSETVSIPDVILESLKSDFSASVAKITDDITEMVSQLNARALSDVTNLSDSGGSKDEARRSWTNLSHLSNYSSSNPVGQRDHIRSKSWDPKEVRLHHRKSMELMKLLEDENQAVPSPSEQVGRKTGLRYSSITTLNSIDDCEPRFCTTKTINLGESKGITIEIKNPVAAVPVAADRMELLATYKARQGQSSCKTDGYNQPAPVSVRVENKENTKRADDARRAAPYARISLKEPEIKIAAVNQTDQTVGAKATALMSQSKPRDAVSPVHHDYGSSVVGKIDHTYWTPIQKRRASEVLFKRGLERQSFDSKVSYFPVAKPRMSLLKPVQPPDPIYSNREEINQKISLSRILRSVTSPTPSEEKDLTPPWRKPSITSTASSTTSRRQSLTVDNSRSISRNSLDSENHLTTSFPESAVNSQPRPALLTCQVDEFAVATEKLMSRYETSLVQSIESHERSPTRHLPSVQNDKDTLTVSPTQTLRVSNSSTPTVSPNQTLQVTKRSDKALSPKRTEHSESVITSTRISTAQLSSAPDSNRAGESPSSLQVVTKSTIRIVWPPPGENVEEVSMQEVRPMRRKSLMKGSKANVPTLQTRGNAVETMEYQKVEPKTSQSASAVTRHRPSGGIDVLNRATKNRNLSPDPIRTQNLDEKFVERQFENKVSPKVEDRPNSVFISNDSNLVRSQIAMNLDKELPEENLKVVPPPRKKKVAFKLSDSTSSPVAEKRLETPVVSSVKAIHFGDMSGDFLWDKRETNQEKPQPISPTVNASKRQAMPNLVPGLAAEEDKPSESVVKTVPEKVQHTTTSSHSVRLTDGIGGASPLLRERFKASSEFIEKGEQLEIPETHQPEPQYSKSVKKIAPKVAEVEYSKLVKKTVSEIVDAKTRCEVPLSKESITTEREDVEKSNVVQLPKPAERASRVSKRASMTMKDNDDFKCGEKDIRKMTGEDASSQFTLVDTLNAPEPVTTQEPVLDVAQSVDPPAKLLSVTPEPPENISATEESSNVLIEKSKTVPLSARSKTKHPGYQNKELPKFILSETPADVSSGKDSSESTSTDVSDAFREILLHRKGQKMTSLPDDSIYISPSLNSYCSNDQLPASEPAYSIYEPTKVSSFLSRRDEQNTYEVVTKKSLSKASRTQDSNPSASSRTPSYVKRMSSHNYSPMIGGSEMRIYQHPTRQASISGSTFERSKSLEHHKAQKEDHDFKLRSLPKDNSAFEKRFARSVSKNEELGKFRKGKSTGVIYAKIQPDSKVEPQPTSQKKGSMERRSERLRRSLQTDFRSSASMSVEEEKTIEDIVKVEGNDLATSLETLIALNRNETDCDDRMTSSACSAITVRENKQPKHYLSFVSVMSRPKAKARRKLFNKEEKNKFVERLSQGSSADGWSETSSIIHTSFAAVDCRSDRQSSVFEYSTSKALKGPLPSLPVAPPRRKQRKPFLPAKVYKPRNGLRSYRSSTSINRSERSNSLRGSQSYSDLKVANQEQNSPDSKVTVTKRSTSTIYQEGSSTSLRAGVSTPSLVGASDDFLKSLQQLAGALETCNKKWGLQEEPVNSVK